MCEQQSEDPSPKRFWKYHPSKYHLMLTEIMAFSASDSENTSMALPSLNPPVKLLL